MGDRDPVVVPRLAQAWAVGVAGYAARQGVDRDTFIDGMQPILTPDQIAKAVLDVAADPGGAAEYQVSGTGVHPIS